MVSPSTPRPPAIKLNATMPVMTGVDASIRSGTPPKRFVVVAAGEIFVAMMLLFDGTAR
jgi:hypothetical protein